MSEPAGGPSDPNPSRRAWVRPVAYGSLLALLGLVGWGLVRAQAGPRDQGPAPDFSLATFSGEQVSLSALRGQVVVINFWASWCPPCRAEAPLLEAAWRHYRDRGVVFLGVNIQDREANARGFLEEFGITFPNGRDPRNRIAIDYGVYGLPETFFISRDGLITYKHIGAIGGDLLAGKMEEALRGAVSAEGRGADYRSIR